MCSKWDIVRARRVPERDTLSLMTFEAPAPAHARSPLVLNCNAGLTPVLHTRGFCNKHTTPTVEGTQGGLRQGKNRLTVYVETECCGKDTRSHRN